MKKHKEYPTIVLVVNRDLESQGEPILTETLTSSEEILEFEMAIMSRDPEPLKRVYSHRLKQIDEDEEFADYVESLLSSSFVRPDVQEHAIQWFKSRAKIEAYQKAEDEASRVIAQYAFQVFVTDQERTDFLLTGPKAKIRVRVVDFDGKQFKNVA